MVIKFDGFWSAFWQRIINSVNFHNKGFYIVVKVDEFDVEQTKVQFNKLNKVQLEKKQLKKLEFTCKWHYKDRTISQNKLMWALIRVIVSVLNGKPMKGKELKEAQDDYYRLIIRQKCDVIGLTVKVGQESSVEDVYSYYEKVGEVNGRVRYIAYKSTSNMNTVEMSEIIDFLFEQLNEMDLDITTSRDIAKYNELWRNENV